jgi:tetratricopeptide (TPR) repeat protein
MGPTDRADAHRLALVLGDLLYQRGRPAEAEQRYRAAARLAPDPADAVDALRLAYGAAGSRQAGNALLELAREAADRAHEVGDDAGAGLDLALAAVLIHRGPGIIAVKPPEGTDVELLAEARSLAPGDPKVEAAACIAEAFAANEHEPEALDLADAAVARAEASGDPLLESAALDQRSAVHLARGDLVGAVADIRRRMEIHAGLRIDARTGFEFSDGFAMASEIHLTAGDIDEARRYADALAGLPFFREEGHLSTARRLKVDAMSGRFHDVLRRAERFRAGWLDAGRPVATNLATAPASVALTHGIRGEHDAQAEWKDIVVAIGATGDWLGGCASGFMPVFDALELLHHGDASAAVERLPARPDELQAWYNGMWRPWYAALWVEAAVLAGVDGAADRLAPGRAGADGNPVALAMIDRAEHLLSGDLDALPALADRLGRAGFPYQAARTLVLAGGDRAAEGERIMREIGATP